MADTASFHLDITGTEDTVVVSPEDVIDGAPVPLEIVRPIGFGGVYSLAVTGTTKAAVTLAPLATRLTSTQHTMLTNTAATEIPASAREDFFDRILPLLRTPAGRAGSDTIISSDDSVDLPVERRPHLNVQISYATAGGRKKDADKRGTRKGAGKQGAPPTRVRLDWSWT